MIKFEWIDLLMNPFMLLFITVVTGLLFGKIKFGKFNFGASGALFTGLIIGWAAYKYGNSILAGGENAVGFDSALKMIGNGIISTDFFDLFLILFVSAVGLIAAKDMAAVLKKYGAKFIILGIIITFVGAAGTYGAALLNTGTSAYQVGGVYVGALTSSPGLAAAVESGKKHAKNDLDHYADASTDEKARMLLVLQEDDSSLTAENTPTLNKQQQAAYISNAEAGVGIGYAIAYPFGVLIVIIAVNFFPKIFRMNMEEEKRRFALEMHEARSNVKTRDVVESPFSLMSFFLACFIGYTVGSIQIYLGPLGYFSLGATGGILIMSLLLGYIGKIGVFNFRMDTKTLSVIREIGLVFFLASVGLRYGFKVFEALVGSGLDLVLIALIVGIVAMMAGFIVGRYVFKLNWIMLVGAICGGMTSTPGLGAAIDATNSDDPATGYGATYPFALLGMVIFTIIMYKLPMT